MNHELETFYSFEDRLPQSKVQWACAINALPFTTKLQVKPGRTGLVAGWVNICVRHTVLNLKLDLGLMRIDSCVHTGVPFCRVNKDFIFIIILY